MAVHIDYSQQAIARALKDLYDPKRLGKQQLAQLSIVLQRLNSAKSSDTPEHRGLVLAFIIEQVITSRMQAESYDLLDWRILYDSALEGKSFEQMARDLGLSRRSMVRYYSRACSTLARALMDVEREARKPTQNQYLPPIPPPMDTVFVGRARELETVSDALVHGQSILLFGMPGVGKSSLARKTLSLRQIKNRSGDGVLWLSACDSLDIVLDALGKSFGIDYVSTAHSAQERISLLRAFLAHKQAILVLDGIDSEETVGELCKNLTIPIMITSRRRFAIALGKTLEVEPPPLSEAVEQFCVHVGHEMPDKQYIPQICETLGNLPLALQIAAHRLRDENLSCRQLLQMLSGNRGPLVVVSPEGRDGRNSSVRFSFDATFSVLGEKAKQVFLASSTFPISSGATLADCATVCHIPEDECLDILRQLVEISILRASGNRFFVHPLIYEYAKVKLAQA